MVTKEKLSAEQFLPKRRTLDSLRAAARSCQGCDLYKNATQTVFGEGAKDADLVLVGEQPGDMPFKILAVLTDKPLHSIIARPEIKTISDLRGKKIGTQRIGGSDHLAAEAILQAKGIDLKDVQFVTLGGDEPVRVEILKKGLVDAVCSVPPGPVRLAREGYNILGGPKDLKIGNPISAVAVTDTRLKTHRDEAKRVLRAVLRGLRFMALV